MCENFKNQALYKYFYKNTSDNAEKFIQKGSKEVKEESNDEEAITSCNC